jgi:hypothetical protein
MRIIDELSNWRGQISIDDNAFDTMEDAKKSSILENEQVHCITLHSVRNNASERKISSLNDTQKCYKITVKQYMTKPSTPTFDFMQRWNNDTPMPLLSMVGYIEKETNGMYYMNLHGDILSKVSDVCMRCGKPINNPVSKYFGMGPICGQHNYVNPFDTEEELLANVERYRREYLNKIKWSGWVIKSAIVEMEEI